MMRPRPVHGYHVVVARRASLWGWEIYRDGVPLPVPLRGGYYKSKRATEGFHLASRHRAVPRYSPRRWRTASVPSFPTSRRHSSACSPQASTTTSYRHHPSRQRQHSPTPTRCNRRPRNLHFTGAVPRAMSRSWHPARLWHIAAMAHPPDKDEYNVVVAQRGQFAVGGNGKSFATVGRYRFHFVMASFGRSAPATGQLRNISAIARPVH
jgi:5-methylcytosine-specific restriction endonuclease McrA